MGLTTSRARGSHFPRHLYGSATKGFRRTQNRQIYLLMSRAMIPTDVNARRAFVATVLRLLGIGPSRAYKQSFTSHEVEQVQGMWILLHDQDLNDPSNREYLSDLFRVIQEAEVLVGGFSFHATAIPDDHAGLQELLVHWQDLISSQMCDRPQPIPFP